MWYRIQHSVIVCPDLEVMHLLDVLPLCHKEIIRIHAIHRHAEKTRNVSLRMVEPDAHVFRHILVMHMELAADRNAFTIQTVPVEWLAFDNIVEIHARASVAKILNVMLLIMCQCVHAFAISKVIHSVDADQYRKYVSKIYLEKSSFLVFSEIFTKTYFSF